MRYVFCPCLFRSPPRHCTKTRCVVRRASIVVRRSWCVASCRHPRDTRRRLVFRSHCAARRRTRLARDQRSGCWCWCCREASKPRRGVFVFVFVFVVVVVDELVLEENECVYITKMLHVVSRIDVVRIRGRPGGRTQRLYKRGRRATRKT